MTDQVLAEVSSYVRNQDAMTVLTQPIDASALTIDLDEATAVSKGVVEIGDELVYIKKVLPTDAQAQILPGTRGWRSTQAVSHAANTLVRNNPVYPRTQVQRAINETITSITLYALDSYEFTFDGVTLLYALPADCIDVTGVTFEVMDSTGRWDTIKTFRIDPNFQVSGVARVGLELVEVPPAGRTVRVQYLKKPSALAVADEFSQTGLPSSCEDVIRLGAMWRLLSTIDPGKVIATSPSADVQDAAVAPLKPGEVSRYIYQLFSARLDEERGKQADNFATVIHWQA